MKAALSASFILWKRWCPQCLLPPNPNNLDAALKSKIIAKNFNRNIGIKEMAKPTNNPAAMVLKIVIVKNFKFDLY